MNYLLNQSYIFSRIGHRFKVSIPQSKTSAYNDAFIATTSCEWNHLQELSVAIQLLDLFKEALTNLLC